MLSIAALLSGKVDGLSLLKRGCSYYLACISPSLLPNLPMPVMNIALASRQQSWVAKHKPAPTFTLTLPSSLIVSGEYVDNLATS